MAQYGRRSEENLKGVHPLLVKVMRVVIRYWDNWIIDGLRELDEQVRNKARGVSKTLESKHLVQPSGYAEAIDTMPYPTDWPAIQRGIDAVKKVDPGMQVLEAYAYAGFVKGVAAGMDIKLRSGIDWDSDAEFSEHSFIDLPHHELDLKEDIP